MKRLLVLLSSLALWIPVIANGQASHATVEHDIQILLIGNITSPSLGEENRKTAQLNDVIWQGNAAAVGPAVYSENWRHNNGLVLGGSYTRTDSKLFDRTREVLLGFWALDRYKLDAVYEHRFRTGNTFRPYLGMGGFLVVLWGGYAPHGWPVPASGLDAWGGLIAPFGVDTVISPRVRLKTGLFVDIGKATTYGDPHYTASQNLMFEPQLGIVYTLGKK